jgi:hypothetical protein
MMNVPPFYLKVALNISKNVWTLQVKSRALYAALRAKIAVIGTSRAVADDI